MIKFISLSSGSKGNSSLVITNEVKIIIDLGLSYPYIVKELEKINITPSDIDYILITHIHSDHTKGLKQFIKKNNVKVLIPEKMVRELSSIIDISDIQVIEDKTIYKDLDIELIYTSHDTECSVGYILTSLNSSLVYITDTGYINKKYMNKLSNKSLYFLESNHDEEMLMDGPYPYHLKQRVISDKGHLSNLTTSKYLSTIVGDKTKYVILAHISENNNTEELAFNTSKRKLDDVNYKGVLMVARQNEATDLIEV